ncbi:MAG TPA: ABC transporter permease, partial [Gemmatimonadaceae bacterium]|nr:ABC transporter permease [Gemmatimonadaceae bacterium]
MTAVHDKPVAQSEALQPLIRDRDDWDTVITPKAGWFDWRLGEMWNHRDLLWLLVRRDFVTVHKQTILGPLWHIVNPLLTALMFSLIFGRVVRIPTDGLPPILFYMAGTVAWNYFIACFFKTNNSLAGNASLFGKVYFHRLTVPVSAVLSSLISFAIQCGIFAVMALIFSLRGAPIRPNAWLFALPLLVALLAGYGLALGLIASALTTRYRDLGQLFGFVTQLLMFATPIIYPLSYVNEQYRWLIRANPLASIMETFRFATLGRGTIDTPALITAGV